MDEDLVEQYPDDEAGPPADVPPSLSCCFVDSPCFRISALNRQSTEQEKWRTLMAFRAKLANQPQLPDSEAAAS